MKCFPKSYSPPFLIFKIFVETVLSYSPWKLNPPRFHQSKRFNKNTHYVSFSAHLENGICQGLEILVSKISYFLQKFHFKKILSVMSFIHRWFFYLSLTWYSNKNTNQNCLIPSKKSLIPSSHQCYSKLNLCLSIYITSKRSFLVSELIPDTSDLQSLMIRLREFRFKLVSLFPSLFDWKTIWKS